MKGFGIEVGSRWGCSSNRQFKRKANKLDIWKERKEMLEKLIEPFGTLYAYAKHVGIANDKMYGMYQGDIAISDKALGRKKVISQ